VTVADLIAQLKTCPAELEVLVDMGDGVDHVDLVALDTIYPPDGSPSYEAAVLELK